MIFPKEIDMTCERSHSILDMLDKQEPIPFLVKLHLLFCDNCKSQEKKIEEVHKLLKEEILCSPIDFTDSVLQALEFEPQKPAPGHQPMRNWLIPGLLIILWLVLAPIMPVNEWFVANFGFALLLPLSITLGTLISIYGGLFVASHMDKINDFFNLHS